MTDIQVPVTSRKRLRGALLQQLQHAWPAPVLLWQGLGHLHEGGPWVLLLLGGAEIVTSALVMAIMTRDLLAYRRGAGGLHQATHRTRGVHSFDIVLAAMLATEAAAHWHETRHLPRPTILMAAVMLALGLFHGRLVAGRARRRALRLTPEGVTIGGRFFTRFTASWADIARIDVNATRASIVTRAGRTREFDFRDIQNAEQVREVLETARGLAIGTHGAGVESLP